MRVHKLLPFVAMTLLLSQTTWAAEATIDSKAAQGIKKSDKTTKTNIEKIQEAVKKASVGTSANFGASAQVAMAAPTGKKLPLTALAPTSKPNTAKKSQNSTIFGTFAPSSTNTLTLTSSKGTTATASVKDFSALANVTCTGISSGNGGSVPTLNLANIEATIARVLYENQRYSAMKATLQAAAKAGVINFPDGIPAALKKLNYYTYTLSNIQCTANNTFNNFGAWLTNQGGPFLMGPPIGSGGNSLNPSITGSLSLAGTGARNTILQISGTPTLEDTNNQDGNGNEQYYLHLGTVNATGQGNLKMNVTLTPPSTSSNIDGSTSDISGSITSTINGKATANITATNVVDQFAIGTNPVEEDN